MVRLPRTALSFFAGVLLVASACSSSSVTWPPVGSPGGGGGGGGGGGSSASAAATVNPNDPNSIITSVLGGGVQLVGGEQNIKSFHVKVALNGTIKAAALKDLLGSSEASLITSDLKLDGTAIQGDVDVVGQAAHLGFNVPAIAFLGGRPITGDLILKDSAFYAKVSLLGTKYTKYDLGDLTSSLPISVPTAGPSTLSNVTTSVDEIRKQLDEAGAKATLVGVEKIGGKDAYHINLSVPLKLINDQIAAMASPSPAPLTLDSAAVDMWAYKDTYYLAQLEVKGASSKIGNLDLIVTVTNYDQPVTITAPPASQVETPAP